MLKWAICAFAGPDFGIGLTDKAASKLRKIPATIARVVFFDLQHRIPNIRF
jgi:hypothetical protein